MVVIGLFVLILLVMDFNNRMAELTRLSAQKEREALEITTLIETQVFLETQMAYATSDAAVEAWAREEGRWVLPGDHLIVPLPPEGYTPEPMYIATPTPQQLTNWEAWKEWFLYEAP